MWSYWPAKAKGEERDRLTLKLESMGEPESDIHIHPAAIRYYAEEIGSVRQEMQRRGYDHGRDSPVSAALRKLIGRSPFTGAMMATVDFPSR